ncbi:hypothetical protein [Zhongshania sp.]|uniref:hypothetical protein n=1 Tax=Zhongshania sp. TaxID=1971902 RepID=UPI00356B3460
MEEMDGPQELKNKIRKGKILTFSIWAVLGLVYSLQLFIENAPIARILLGPLDIVIPLLIGYLLYESKLRMAYKCPNKEPLKWFLSPVILLPLIGLVLWLAAW